MIFGTRTEDSFQPQDPHPWSPQPRPNLPPGTAAAWRNILGYCGSCYRHPMGVPSFCTQREALFWGAVHELLFLGRTGRGSRRTKERCFLVWLQAIAIRLEAIASRVGECHSSAREPEEIRIRRVRFEIKEPPCLRCCEVSFTKQFPFQGLFR